MSNRAAARAEDVLGLQVTPCAIPALPAASLVWVRGWWRRFLDRRRRVCSVPPFPCRCSRAASRATPIRWPRFGSTSGMRRWLGWGNMLGCPVTVVVCDAIANLRGRAARQRPAPFCWEWSVVVRAIERLHVGELDWRCSSPIQGVAPPRAADVLRK